MRQFKFSRARSRAVPWCGMPRMRRPTMPRRKGRNASASRAGSVLRRKGVVHVVSQRHFKHLQRWRQAHGNFHVVCVAGSDVEGRGIRFAIVVRMQPSRRERSLERGVEALHGNFLSCYTRRVIPGKVFSWPRPARAGCQTVSAQTPGLGFGKGRLISALFAFVRADRHGTDLSFGMLALHPLPACRAMGLGAFR